jgi:hypothetical protein
MNKNVLLVAMKVILSEFREGTYAYVRMGRVDTLRYTTGNENDGSRLQIWACAYSLFTHHIFPSFPVNYGKTYNFTLCGLRRDKIYKSIEETGI